MKKILSILVCLCIICSMIPAFTVSAEDEPQWVASFGALKNPGTVVGDYIFTGNDIPGEKVYHNYTDTTNFSGDYITDGFKVSRVSNFKTGKEKTLSKEYMRLNFVKKAADDINNKDIYYYGLKGTYAIDLTVNMDLTAAEYKNAIIYDGYIIQSNDYTVCSEEVKGTDASYGGTNVQMRFTVKSGTNLQKFQIFDNSNTTDLKTGQIEIEHKVDTIIRIIVNTETGNLALYSSTDGENFTYYGSLNEVFKGDMLQSFIFNPRLGIIKNSDMIFKNVKIYEIESVADTENVIPKVEIQRQSSGEGEDEESENGLPEWLKDFATNKTPGTEVADYKFTGKDIPGESIPNTFDTTNDFKGEYTEDGFVMTKLTEAVDDDHGKESKVGGVLQFVANIDNDLVNETSTYQHGFVGTYVVDLYVNSNLAKKISKSGGVRFDWDIGYQSNLTDGTKLENTFNEVRVLSGSSSNVFTVYGSSAYDQGDRYIPKGKDTIVRLVIDTKEKQMAYFVYKNDEFVYSGSGAYGGDIIQSIYFTPRLGFAKGSTFTFKGVKIYEIEKYINADLGDADRNQEVINAMADENIMPTTLCANPNGVTDNLILPSGSWTTTDGETISKNGVITRGYDDQKVTLTNKFKTVSTPAIQLFRKYDLNVLRRADIVDKTILDKNINDTVDNYEEIVSRIIDSDSYSKTYINNLKGVFDLEFKIKPLVTKTYDENGKPITIKVGYKKGDEFINYATADIYNDVVKYATNISEVSSAPVVNGGSNTLKFRVDTVNKKVWVYINNIKSNVMYYKGNDFVNAFNLLDNDETTDSVVLESIKVVSLFTFDNNNFSDVNINNCFDKSALITISNVTSKPFDAYGPMGDLPESLGEYAVKWSSDTDYVDLEAKCAYRNTEDQNVTVTAEIYDTNNPDISVKKDFNIKILKTSDPETILEGTTSSKLTTKYITNQPADGLIADIVLPTQVMGNTVSWKVLDDNAVIEIVDNKGVIKTTRNIKEPTNVVLEATVTDGVNTVKKVINFKVAKRGGNVTLYTSSSNIETPIKGVVTYSADLNGMATLKDSNGKKIIELDGTCNVKVIMDFNNRKVIVFKDGVLTDDYIDFTEFAENFVTVASSSVSNEEIILDEYALYNYNIEKFGYLDVLNKGVITSGIEMTKSSVGGVKVDWDSKNTSILTNTGMFNAPNNITFFEVDFSLTNPEGTDAKFAKTLEVVAIPKNNIFIGAQVVNQGTSVPAGQYHSAAINDGNYTDTMFRGLFENESKSIIIDMLNVQDINNIYLRHNGLKSVKIYVSENKTNWDLVANPSFDGTFNSDVVKFDKQKTRYVKIDTIIYDGDYVDIYEIAGFAVYSSTDKSYMDILALNMPEEFVLSASSINLPTVGSVYSSKMVWKSSHPDVISANGTITVPKNNTEVLLTVTSTNGESSSTRTYRYYIKGTSGAEGGKPSGGSAGGGGGGTFVGDTSASAFPEVNTNAQEPVINTTKDFNDVSKDSWSYNYIMALRKVGIIDGDDKNNYNPDKLVTREEFVKMIVNVANVEMVENGKGFTDVKSTDWFAPYVYTAKANGIVNGIDADKFGVGSAISRQDMAVIINNVININADISTNRDLFADDFTISNYAYNAVYSMKALGILNGYNDGNYKPQGKLTRAEAAKVISMVMDIIK